MTLALAVGKRGLGQCWPNPAVGAVIATPDDGRVIAYAWTSPGGRPHAETQALAQAGEAARGATLYVTLEPCSHWGKTPPCADAAIAAGIARVVYGIADPDPRVAGEGLARLAAHGVEVVESELAKRARWLTLGHVLRVTKGRPFVQLKLAVDAQGAVPLGEDGAPVWVTGKIARDRGHVLRADADAILIGRGTALADNPDLTCRLPGMEWRSPVRVVLASDARLSDGARMLASLNQAPVWVLHAPDAPAENISRLRDAGAECFTVERDAIGGLAPAPVLAVLAGRGITRLLVEGGPTVAASFFRAGLADEAVIFQSKKILSGPSLKPQAGLAEINNHDQYVFVQSQSLGDDRMLIYRRSAMWLG